MRAIGAIGAACLLGGALLAGSAAADPGTDCHGTRIAAMASLPADRLYGTWFVSEGVGSPLGPDERLHFEPGPQIQTIDVTSRNRPSDTQDGNGRVALRLQDPGQNVYRASYEHRGSGEWKFLDQDTYGSAVIVAECTNRVDRVLLLTSTANVTKLQRDFADDWWANHGLKPTTVDQRDDPF